MAVAGEGEWVLVELLAALEAGGDLAGIAGLLWRDGDGVRENAARPIPKDLDDLPLPAWDLLPGFPHAYPPAIYDYPRGPVATLAASPGCPFHCKFSDTSTFGARVRAYSPARVVEMIQHLYERWGVRHVAFVDDLFLASRLRVTEFCERLLASGLGITWTCTARVDTVKPEILALMKRAGCWEISFGLETGSDALLQAMDKAARGERSDVRVGRRGIARSVAARTRPVTPPDASDRVSIALRFLARHHAALEVLGEDEVVLQSQVRSMLLCGGA